MTKQNCISYKNGRCLHQAAPRRLFGPALCILDHDNPDPRIPAGCALQTPLPLAAALKVKS
jgi:hypothetical protein